MRAHFTTEIETVPKIKNSYSTILRAIGQELEARGLKTFELRPDGDVYIVACGYQEPPSATPVTLHYSWEDIEDLDRAGSAIYALCVGMYKQRGKFLVVADRCAYWSRKAG